MSKQDELFKFEGNAELKDVIPLSFQHVVAMIAGCISPAIILSGAAGLPAESSTILIQMSLLGAGITTLMMLYKVGKFGAKLPVIYGAAFTFMQATIGIYMQYEPIYGFDAMAVIFGAQIIGGIVTIIFGLLLDKLGRFFPPLVTGTITLVIGLSLYSIAIRYMGGAGSVTAPGWGAWQNWLVGFLTLFIALGLEHFGRGIFKLANVLFALIAGYIIAFIFGMVDLSSVGQATWFAPIRPLYFGLKFELSAIITISIIFIVSTLAMIGTTTSTTTGAYGRVPTSDELQGSTLTYGVSNIIGAFFGSLPTGMFAQNVGIVTSNKVVNRKVFVCASIFLIVAGIVPKVSAFLTTIPYPVLGGATLPVFATITMNGIRTIISQPLTKRNSSIVGVSVALGFGLNMVASEASLQGISFMPDQLYTVLASSPVVLSSLSALLMNVIIPEKEEDKVKS